MYALHIHTLGTTNTAISRHESLADAHHALARFARGYEIFNYGNGSGTISARNQGGVTQAAYSWRIDSIHN